MNLKPGYYIVPKDMSLSELNDVFGKYKCYAYHRSNRIVPFNHFNDFFYKRLKEKFFISIKIDNNGIIEVSDLNITYPNQNNFLEKIKIINEILE